MQLGQTIPFSFFDLQGVDLSNYDMGDVVAETRKIPAGYKGIIKDNDLIFTNTGGKVNYVIKRASGGETIFRQGVFSDDAGFVNKVLKSGDKVQLILHTVGTGVIDLLWDGEIKKSFRNLKYRK